MKKSIVLLVVVLVGAASPALAKVEIKSVYFDPPGSDANPSNSDLNKEYVVIQNTGDKDRSLRRWKLSDSDGHRYKFGDFTLKAGRTVKVHTGDGSDTASHLYWDLGNWVWNNADNPDDPGDKAKLRKRDGKVADTCAYGKDASSPKQC